MSLGQSEKKKSWLTISGANAASAEPLKNEVGKEGREGGRTQKMKSFHFSSLMKENIPL